MSKVCGRAKTSVCQGGWCALRCVSRHLIVCCSQEQDDVRVLRVQVKRLLVVPPNVRFTTAAPQSSVSPKRHSSQLLGDYDTLTILVQAVSVNLKNVGQQLTNTYTHVYTACNLIWVPLRIQINEFDNKGFKRRERKEMIAPLLPIVDSA